MNFQYPDFTLPPFLIVDDSEDDIFLLRHRLREARVGNPIHAFSSASDALAHLRIHEQEIPAMIFTDIRMPVDSGFALIASIRANPAWDDTRLVVVTSSNDTADLVRALELGANGYLIKFPPPDILRDFLRNGPWFKTSRRDAPAVNAIAV